MSSVFLKKNWGVSEKNSWKSCHVIKSPVIYLMFVYFCFAQFIISAGWATHDIVYCIFIRIKIMNNFWFLKACMSGYKSKYSGGRRVGWEPMWKKREKHAGTSLCADCSRRRQSGSAPIGWDIGPATIMRFLPAGSGRTKGVAISHALSDRWASLPCAPLTCFILKNRSWASIFIH